MTRRGPAPFSMIKPAVTEILKRAIQDGKGIEVNTSSHRYGLKDTQPSVDILKLYRSLGGEIITIGSDSHKPEHLGAYIPETQALLRGTGDTGPSAPSTGCSRSSTTCKLHCFLT